MIIKYNPKLKALARELRKNATHAEIMLWQRLRRKQFHNLDFHRQKPIDEFIVDFFCPELKLIVEIDGISHDTKLDQDRQRQGRLEALGFSVARFLDAEVRNNLEGVLLVLEKKTGFG
ncbi:endonuclease domain-containing protein [bacterium]|nr:endonuclease domain-containing protein [bacterium]